MLTDDIKAAYLEYVNTPEFETKFRALRGKRTWLLWGLLLIPTPLFAIGLGMILGFFWRKRVLRKALEKERQLVQSGVPIATFPMVVDRDLVYGRKTSGATAVVGSFDPTASDAFLLRTASFIDHTRSSWHEEEAMREVARPPQVAAAFDVLADQTYYPDKRIELPRELTGDIRAFHFHLWLSTAEVPKYPGFETMPERFFPFAPCLASPGEEGFIRQIPISLCRQALREYVSKTVAAAAEGAERDRITEARMQFDPWMLRLDEDPDTGRSLWFSRFLQALEEADQGISDGPGEQELRALDRTELNEAAQLLRDRISRSVDDRDCVTLALTETLLQPTTAPASAELGNLVMLRKLYDRLWQAQNARDWGLAERIERELAERSARLVRSFATEVEALRAHGLNIAADLLETLEQQSLVLVDEVEDEGASAGTIRLGGRPHVPEGFIWPRYKGRSLDFVAEIDVGELPRVGRVNELPPDGRLLFFYAGESWDCGEPDDRGETEWRVLFFGNDVGPFPQATLPDDLADLGEPPSRGLRPVVKPSYPGELLPGRTGSIYPDEERSGAMYVLWRAFENDGQGQYPTPLHRLFGYADILEADGRRGCELASRGVSWTESQWYSPLQKTEIERQLNDWVLLLQLDTDEQVGMMWGDMGRIGYWIRRQDLAANAFDRCYTALDTT